MRSLCPSFLLVMLISCGSEKDKTSSGDQHIPTNDITDVEVAEFNQKIAGSWSHNIPETGELNEGYSFNPSSSEDASGSLGYFANDASGSTGYALISKKVFEHEQKPWTAWVIEQKLPAWKSTYVLVCHLDTESPNELRYYGYKFGNVEDCFGDTSKTLTPFKVEAL